MSFLSPLPPHSLVFQATSHTRHPKQQFEHSLIRFAKSYYYMAGRICINFTVRFITDSFLAEQASKPEITKIMEGSNISNEEIQDKIPSALSIAQKILNGLEKGYFSITSDWETALILNNNAWAESSR